LLKRRKKRGGNQALGRGCGGFSTKIHASCDALGNPIRFILTAGGDADCNQALPLIDGLKYQYLLADKAYDADFIVNEVTKNASICVIPPKKNRIIKRECDFFIYKSRHKIENMFGFLKHYRRIFSRFDKLARNYMSFISLASTLIWLK
jgi:transposase